MPRSRSKPLPFHTDLNGRERVNRALARKLWSWGIPVQIDAGRGAVSLQRPASIPEQDSAGEGGPFRTACLRAAPECARPAKYKNAVFLAPSGTMCVHFEFTDGSNPFVKYGTHIELLYELRAWAREYDMTAKNSGTDRIAAFMLKSRRKETPMF